MDDITFVRSHWWLVGAVSNVFRRWYKTRVRATSNKE